MKLTVSPGLPISERADELQELITSNQVVVIAGETGSGKTTQLPKLVLAAGANNVVHTQPRRIAARSVAKRIAQECQTELGAEVGYAVRFDDQSTAETRIRVVTDGLLLSELAHDRDLRRYDAVIIDEAHERSLAIDFLLGYLARLVQRRSDLRVVITSATIDVDRFAELFTTTERKVPVVEVSGRTYPVEIRYRPMEEHNSAHLPEAVADAIKELPRDGDVLVFASGEREIRDLTDYLAGRWQQSYDVLALHGRMPTHEQQKVFAPEGRRRIVIATNVAETSLTVPRIRYVVDPGFARISRFSTRHKIQRLPIEPISQASAAQRAGRCGRVAEGICIRLYSEEDHDGRPEFTDPEIQRTNLASVLLHMALLKLGPIEDFGFLDQPDSRAIASGKSLLTELGALEGTRLTEVGRRMARLPVDPRMARMLLAAAENDSLADVLVIISALSIQDPRERPTEEREKADQFHRRFHSPTSDFLSFLALWNYLKEQRDKLSHTKFRAMCRNEYLHYVRIREWQDVHAQLKQTLRELNLKIGTSGADPDTIHQAIITGLLSHLAMRVEDTRQYQGARGTEVLVWPGSGLAKKPPEWLMAAEFMETSRVWAHTVAAINPAWAETAGQHLLKKQFGEPRWSRKRGAAVASLRATLYGLPVVTNRTVNLAPQDPELARELFIRHALVYGEWRTHHAFVRRNAKVLSQMHDIEDRTRRRDIAVTDEQLYDFFDARLPNKVVSVRHFDSWWRKTKNASPHLLDFSGADFTVDIAHADREFPTTWTSQSSDYELDYHYEPGTTSDGIEVKINLLELSNVDTREFDWLVPGLREELLTELIKTLPKHLRRQFAPASSYAQQLVKVLDPAGAPLIDQLARALSQTVAVSAADFDVTQLPNHLRMTYVIVRDGKELARGKDLLALKRRVTKPLKESVLSAYKQQEVSGLTAWPDDGVSPRLEQGPAVVWPALVDEGTSVGVRVFTDQQEQYVAMCRGISRLMSLTMPNPTIHIAQRLPMADSLLLSTARYPDAKALIYDAWLTAIDDLVLKHGGPVWDKAAFTLLYEKVRQDVMPQTETLVKHVVNALGVMSRINPTNEEAAEDIETQMSWLIYSGFIRDMGAARLPRLAVYLAAAAKRANSTKNADPLYELEARFYGLTRNLSDIRRLCADVQQARWALEELRISWFAQELRTAFSISEKKVAAMLDALAATLEAGISPRPRDQ